MKSNFKLYWVDTPSSEENCFVAAKSKRDAARFEENGTGFNPGDCVAELVRSLEQDWVTQHLSTKQRGPADISSPFYVQFEDVKELGIQWRIIEGDDVFSYHGRKFRKLGDMNYLASLARRRKKMVIESVEDLLKLIKQSEPSEWIFRGHGSCRWHLVASAHRITRTFETLEQRVSFERRLLGEFKRRARILLPNRPSSDWEWMVLAQHFGLPTRVLDWTENPLVALYFSVRDNAELPDDGMLYAYRHGKQEIDIESASDPFSIQDIELVRPPHLDQRVIAQQSVLTVEPPDIAENKNRDSDLNWWHVSINRKAEIRRELANLGILESSLFPGLTSIASEIKNELLWNAAPKKRLTKANVRIKSARPRAGGDPDLKSAD